MELRLRRSESPHRARRGPRTLRRGRQNKLGTESARAHLTRRSSRAGRKSWSYPPATAPSSTSPGKRRSIGRRKNSRRQLAAKTSWCRIPITPHGYRKDQAYGQPRSICAAWSAGWTRWSLVRPRFSGRPRKPTKPGARCRGRPPATLNKPLPARLSASARRSAPRHRGSKKAPPRLPGPRWSWRRKIFGKLGNGCRVMRHRSR